MNDLDKIRDLLTPYDLGHEKIRVGPWEDGGYVISRQCLERTDLVYSLGVGPNCYFDLELADLGLEIYQFEASWTQPVINHSRFIYTHLYMDSNNFTKAVIANRHYGKNMMLAMDIEGGEYDLLLNTPLPLLEQFNQIVMEAHYLLDDPRFIPMIERLQKNFVLTHIHANNYCIQQGSIRGYRDGVPNVVELTYVNRREIDREPRVSTQPCPDPKLDAANATAWDDLTLDWWLEKI